MKLRYRYGAVLLLFQVFVACDTANKAVLPKDTAARTGCNGAAQSNDIEAKYQVIAFGDSLYAGYQLGPCDGFAPQLEAALRNKGMSVSVLNAGVSGDTSAAGLARLTFVLDNVKHKPDMVILGLGGNDMLRGIKPEETKANLSKIMDELAKRSIKIVLTGMFASPNMGSDYASKFNAIYPNLAKDYDATLYPFFLEGVVTDRAMLLNDNIHPNKQGVARIVAGIGPAVQSALNTEK